MTWEGVDLDAIEAELDAIEAEPGGVEELSRRELEDAFAIMSLEVLQLTTALEAEHRLRSSQATELRKVADLEGEVHGLRRALASAETRAQEAEARAAEAEAAAASLRAELEAVRASAPAWVSIRDRHAGDLERHAL